MYVALLMLYTTNNYTVVFKMFCMVYVYLMVLQLVLWHYLMRDELAVLLRMFGNVRTSKEGEEDSRLF